MDFAPQQVEAINKVGEWLKQDAGPQTFYLAGYAGTGKTTIAKHLANLQDGDVMFAAYTGKAASVLTKKGCPASTIHRMIYKLKRADEREIERVKKELVEKPGDEILKAKIKELYRPQFVFDDESPAKNCALIVVDEVSMVGEKIGMDLLRLGTKILVLGDPGQLPPVEGGGYFTAKTPDFILTDVHRQARDNPIINMATMVRQGNRLAPGKSGNSECVHKWKLLPQHFDGCEQTIVGRNVTRAAYNSTLRDKLGFTGTVPKVGEKVICLRNNHELGLLNGTQWFLDGVEDQGTYVALKLQDIDVPLDRPIEVTAHHFDVDLKELQPWDRRKAEEFDFGYAITCHKSQGSQWKSVFIVNESFCFKENASKWLYTALTRAEERVVVVL